MTDAQIYAGAAVMGAVAGMRSMTAPAFVSRLVRSGMPVAGGPLGFLNAPIAGRTTMLLAAGELIADKLPFLPRRTQAASLIARAVSGAVSGAAVCSAKKRSVLRGALIGMGAAIGATYAAYELRRRAGARFGIPDPAIAVIEDAIAAGCGAFILSRLKA
ncbi:MAG: DUF4126 family protein [Bryobacteraceae bacterium]